MRKFLTLLENIQAQSQISAKTALLYTYLRETDERIIQHLVHLLLFKEDYVLTDETQLYDWFLEISEHDSELLRDCQNISSNLLETISLLKQNMLPKAYSPVDILLKIRKQKNTGTEEIKRFVLGLWKELDGQELLLFHLIITGQFIEGITQKTIYRALSLHYQYPEEHIRQSLSKNRSIEKITIPEILKGKNLLSEEIQIIDNYKPKCIPFSQVAETDFLFPANEIIPAFCVFKNNKIYIQYFNKQIQIIDLKSDIINLNETVFFVLIFATNNIQELENLSISSEFPLEKVQRIEMIDIIDYPDKKISNDIYSERRKLLREIKLPEVFSLSPTVFKGETTTPSFVIPSAHLPGQETLYTQYPLNSITTILTHATLGMGKRQVHYSDYTFSIFIENELKSIVKLTPFQCQKFTSALNHFIAKNTVQKFGNMLAVKPDFICEITFEKIEKTQNHNKPFLFKHPAIKRHYQTLSLADISDIKDLNTLILP